MKIDIPDSMIYRLDDLARDLCDYCGWEWWELSTDEHDQWDIHYREHEEDGEGKNVLRDFYFMLDGSVYTDNGCMDYNGDIDYRNVLSWCDVVWIVVPPEVDQHRVIGIIG